MNNEYTGEGDTVENRLSIARICSKIRGKIRDSKTQMWESS